VNVAERLTEAGNAPLDRQQKGASTTLATPIEPKLILRSGFAISFIGHMVILAIGLIFAGANPFDSMPADAITVEIVSPNEVGGGADNSGTAPAGSPETAPSSEPTAEPDATAPQPQATPSSTPQAATPSTPQPTPPSTAQSTPPSTPKAMPQATTPPDQRSTRQALAPTQAVPPPPPSLMPWFEPPPEPAPPAETHEPNPADMFAMPLTMPDGRLGGSFDAAAIEKADISNDDMAAFHNHLKTCSKLPAGVSMTDNVKAVVRVFLKPDGTLAARPEAIRVDGVSIGGGELYQSIVAALRKCQPFTMLPPDKYDEWKVFDLSFTPQSFGGG
jgi:hypothetical protein